MKLRRNFILEKIENYNQAKEAGDFFIKKGVKNSIITLGDKGIYFTNQSSNFSLPALDLKNKVKDTTGAGDAFSGALASGLEKNGYQRMFKICNKSFRNFYH